MVAGRDRPDEVHRTARFRELFIQGAVALAVRQIMVRLVTLAGTIALARLLEPADFGIYSIVVFLLGAFYAIGDVGLGAALIQQHQEPCELQLRVAFTGQLMLGLLGGVGLALGAPLLASAYGLSDRYADVFRLLACALVVGALRITPTLRLERQLAFPAIAKAEAAYSIVFQLVTVASALMGLGALSVAAGALLATVTSVALLYHACPWRPRLAWSFPVLRDLLSFGLLYQSSTIVSFAKDAVNPVFIGMLVGTTAVGYVSLASTAIGYTLMLPWILNRLLFSSFSRLRDDPERLARVVERVIRWNLFIAVGLGVVLLAAADGWIVLLFGPQWRPAASLLPWLGLAIPLAAASAPGLALMNAYRRADLTLRFTLLWMALTWVFTVPFVLTLGWWGYGPANALVQLTGPIFLAAARRLLPFRLARDLSATVAAAALALGIVWGLRTAFTVDGLSGTLAAGAVALGVYLVTWFAFERNNAIQDIRDTWRVVLPGNRTS
jgi:teichuronic acid exporter